MKKGLSDMWLFNPLKTNNHFCITKSVPVTTAGDTEWCAERGYKAFLHPYFGVLAAVKLCNTIVRRYGKDRFSTRAMIVNWVNYNEYHAAVLKNMCAYFEQRRGMDLDATKKWEIAAQSKFIEILMSYYVEKSRYTDKMYLVNKMDYMDALRALIAIAYIEIQGGEPFIYYNFESEDHIVSTYEIAEKLQTVLTKPISENKRKQLWKKIK